MVFYERSPLRQKVYAGERIGLVNVAYDRRATSSTAEADDYGWFLEALKGPGRFSFWGASSGLLLAACRGLISKRRRRQARRLRFQGRRRGAAGLVGRARLTGQSILHTIRYSKFSHGCCWHPMLRMDL
jgi:hypothetical protein